ncbi:hypothetical protein [Methylogaea oryzae]|nr:hypothetical protein [Methylogaea oryzae]
MLQNELLGRERIRIAAGDYFAGGTRVIEDGLGLFDAMVALAIGQAGRLELQRRASYRQAWGFFLAFAAASIGAGLSLGAA